jgi:hypothetical protein
MWDGPKAGSKLRSPWSCRRASKASASASFHSSCRGRGCGCCRQRRAAGSRSACCRGANQGPTAATRSCCFGSVGCRPACERHPAVAWSACKSVAWSRWSAGGLAASRAALRCRSGARGWRQAACRRAAGWTGWGASCSGSCSVGASRRALASGAGWAASRNSGPAEGSVARRTGRGSRSAAGRKGLGSRSAAGLDSRSAAGLDSRWAAGLDSTARHWAWARGRCPTTARGPDWGAGPRRSAQRAMQTQGTQGPRADALSSWEVAPTGKARAQATRIPNFSAST